MEKQTIPSGQIITIKAGKFKGNGAKFVRWIGGNQNRAEVIINGKIRILSEKSITGEK